LADGSWNHCVEAETTSARASRPGTVAPNRSRGKRIPSRIARRSGPACARLAAIPQPARGDDQIFPRRIFAESFGTAKKVQTARAGAKIINDWEGRSPGRPTKKSKIGGRETAPPSQNAPTCFHPRTNFETPRSR